MIRYKYYKGPLFGYPMSHLNFGRMDGYMFHFDSAVIRESDITSIVLRIKIVLQIIEGNESNPIMNRITNHRIFSFSYKMKK